MLPQAGLCWFMLVCSRSCWLCWTLVQEYPHAALTGSEADEFIPALTSTAHGLTAVSYRLLHLSLVGFHLHLESLHQLLHAVLVLLVLLGLEEQLLQTPLVLTQALHRLSVSLLLAVQLQLQLLHLSVYRDHTNHSTHRTRDQGWISERDQTVMISSGQFLLALHRKPIK